MNSTHWTADEVHALQGLRVLVVGDFILDRYIWGRANRVSPEAPVLVVEYESERSVLGGAGNVVNNICAAGAAPVPCGIVGDDGKGAQIRELLTEQAAPSEGILTDLTRPTIEKTRLMAGAQQIVRIDREQRHPIAATLLEQALQWVEAQVPRCQGVILSDYLKGMLPAELIRSIVAVCRKHGLRVVADPKGAEYQRYEGVDYITPNLREAQTASGITVRDDASLREAGARLMAITQGRGVIVTRGHEDTAVFQVDTEAPVMVPVYPREVYDVTGAGDTFITYFALALFAGHDAEAAVDLGNLAGGLAVEKIGAAAVSAQEVQAEIEGIRSGRKFKTLAELEPICARLRNENKRLILFHGQFDTFDGDIIQKLNQARAQADALIVSLQSPPPAAGEAEMGLTQRAEILSTLQCVEYIVACPDPLPTTIARKLKPAFLTTLALAPGAVLLSDTLPLAEQIEQILEP